MTGGETTQQKGAAAKNKAKAKVAAKKTAPRRKTAKKAARRTSTKTTKRKALSAKASTAKIGQTSGKQAVATESLDSPREQVKSAMKQIIGSIVAKAKSGSMQHAKFLLEQYPEAEQGMSASERKALTELLLDRLETEEATAQV